MEHKVEKDMAKEKILDVKSDVNSVPGDAEVKVCQCLHSAHSPPFLSQLHLAIALFCIIKGTLNNHDKCRRACFPHLLSHCRQLRPTENEKNMLNSCSEQYMTQIDLFRLCLVMLSLHLRLKNRPDKHARW